MCVCGGGGIIPTHPGGGHHPNPPLFGSRLVRYHVSARIKMVIFPLTAMENKPLKSCLMKSLLEPCKDYLFLSVTSRFNNNLASMHLDSSPIISREILLGTVWFSSKFFSQKPKICTHWKEIMTIFLFFACLYDILNQVSITVLNRHSRKPFIAARGLNFSQVELATISYWVGNAIIRIILEPRCEPTSLRDICVALKPPVKKIVSINWNIT